VRQGSFREDLYYRLNVLPLALPPLRAHPSDIPSLIRYYVDMFNREFRKNVTGVSTEAQKGLEAYPWPGNIRELRNAVERAMLLTEGDTLLPDHFPVLAPRAQFSQGVELPAGGLDLEQLERDLVVQALARTAGNQTRAASLLGLNRDQIRYRIEKFGLKV
jgi:DNA-binding NtrC family response regulator